MKTRAPIEAVLFDADGVMQRGAPEWHERLEALCPQPNQVDSFLADVFEAERPCLVGAAEFDRRLGVVLERWKVREALPEVLRIWELIEPCEEIFEISERLRRAGVLVGLATNQQRFRSQYMTEELGYGSRFDVLFFSHEIGCAKPDVAFFRHLIRTLDRPPSRLLFVDDSPANAAAAEEAGFQAQVYDPRTGSAGMRALLANHGLPVD